MDRAKLAPDYGPPLMPVALVGAKINNRPNFYTCGWFSRVNMKPAIWMINAGEHNFTVTGIKATKTFSINYPGSGLLEKVDYCGLVSGKDTDKSQLFSVFYGELETAPMIEEASLCLELKLLEIKTMPAGQLVFGEVINIYTKKEYLSPDGTFDITKSAACVLTTPDTHYRLIGGAKGQAWGMGKALIQ